MSLYSLYRYIYISTPATMFIYIWTLKYAKMNSLFMYNYKCNYYYYIIYYLAIVVACLPVALHTHIQIQKFNL